MLCRLPRRGERDTGAFRGTRHEYTVGSSAPCRASAAAVCTAANGWSTSTASLSTARSSPRPASSRRAARRGGAAMTDPLLRWTTCMSAFPLPARAARTGRRMLHAVNGIASRSPSANACRSSAESVVANPTIRRSRFSSSGADRRNDPLPRSAAYRAGWPRTHAARQGGADGFSRDPYASLNRASRTHLLAARLRLHGITAHRDRRPDRDHARQCGADARSSEPLSARVLRAVNASASALPRPSSSNRKSSCWTNRYPPSDVSIRADHQPAAGPAGKSALRLPYVSPTLSGWR